MISFSGNNCPCFQYPAEWSLSLQFFGLGGGVKSIGPFLDSKISVKTTDRDKFVSNTWNSTEVMCWYFSGWVCQHRKVSWRTNRSCGCLKRVAPNITPQNNATCSCLKSPTDICLQTKPLRNWEPKSLPIGTYCKRYNNYQSNSLSVTFCHFIIFVSPVSLFLSSF